MAAQPLRYAGYDGRLSDLISRKPASLMPLVSVDWAEELTWDGTGVMPSAEEQRGCATSWPPPTPAATGCASGGPRTPGPARAAIRRELVDAGVDRIDTDDLAGLEAFLSR